MSTSGPDRPDSPRGNPTCSDGASSSFEPEPQSAGDGMSASEFFQEVEREIPFLRRRVRRWHRDRADADDLIQDTLAQAFANAHQWQPRSDLRAWLFTIMRNQFLTECTDLGARPRCWRASCGSGVGLAQATAVSPPPRPSAQICALC